LRKLSFFAPSCLQRVNPVYEAFGLALYCHPAADAEGEGEAVAVTYKIQININEAYSF
jgi:hypothetical protein